jgi:hypothetical protein
MRENLLRSKTAESPFCCAAPMYSIDNDDD